MTYRLLDLFCCQGGAAVGYARAGFQVVGVDREAQPHFPYEFRQEDVLSLPLDFLRSFDAIHASPPCKVHTRMKAFSGDHWTDLIPETRAMLREAGVPYVIENVPGAPLENPVQLCATAFHKDMIRHRLFEASFPLTGVECRHKEQASTSPGYPVKRYHSGAPVTRLSKVLSVYGRGGGGGPGETDLWRSVMDMPWASKDGLREAIPPYYTEHIGKQLSAHLDAVLW